MLMRLGGTKRLHSAFAGGAMGDRPGSGRGVPWIRAIRLLSVPEPRAITQANDKLPDFM